MIVTVTPNPSIDRTVTLGTVLTRGAVHRLQSVSSEPGGKGVNVARALALAGVDTLAVLPASPATRSSPSSIPPVSPRRPCRSTVPCGPT